MCRPRARADSTGGSPNAARLRHCLDSDTDTTRLLSTLIHIATIDLEVQGQAFSWAKDGTRTIFTIDRRKLLVRTIEVPPVTPTDAKTSVPFR